MEIIVFKQFCVIRLNVFPCKIFDFQSPANWILCSFLIILRRKKPYFDTLEFVRTPIVSTDDPILDSIFTVLMTAVSASSTWKCPWKLLFTLNSDTLSVSSFVLFTLSLTDCSVRTRSALLWDSHLSTNWRIYMAMRKGCRWKRKWFVTHIKVKRVGTEIIAALFQCFSKQLVNLPSFL